MKKFPHELSGGEQQRVSIARAIAKNPKIAEMADVLVRVKNGKISDYIEQENPICVDDIEW